MKHNLRRFWKWLSGKKRNIGIAGIAVMEQDFNFITENMSHDWELGLKLFFYALAGVGMIHGDMKNVDRSVINKLNKVLNKKNDYERNQTERERFP